MAVRREKIKNLMDNLKTILDETCKKWLQKIEESNDGSISVDIMHEFGEIFARNITTITLGFDISDVKVKLMSTSSIIDTDSPLVEKELSIPDCIPEISSYNITHLQANFKSVWTILYFLSGLQRIFPSESMKAS